MPLDAKDCGVTWINVGLSEEEMQEIIYLIDDEPVDEELLKGIRGKMKNRMKRLRRKQEP